MPELPEVETVVRELQKSIFDQTVSDVKILHAGLVKQASSHELKDVLLGVSVKSIRRRGKLIIVGLSNDHYLLIHLKMTGQLVLNQELENASTRAVLTFENGDKLFYNDMRKFGFWQIVDEDELRYVLEERFNFGPEPLTPDFKLKEFAQKVKKSRRSVKAILLDQTVVAGIGNIYADEALFRARIHPATPGVEVNDQSLKDIHASIRETLKEAVKLGGSSSRNYVRVSGEQGSFQEKHRVYRKTGQPCFNCSAPIERTVVAGRGTHFCSVCQPIKHK